MVTKRSTAYLQAALDCIGTAFAEVRAYDYMGMWDAGGEL